MTPLLEGHAKITLFYDFPLDGSEMRWFLRHLGQEVSEVRVGLIADAFVELMMQNLPEPPPGCGLLARSGFHLFHCKPSG